MPLEFSVFGVNAVSLDGSSLVPFLGAWAAATRARWVQLTPRSPAYMAGALLPQRIGEASLSYWPHNPGTSADYFSRLLWHISPRKPEGRYCMSPMLIW